MLGWSEHRLGRHAAALATFRRALALEPDGLSVRFDVALVLLHLGRAEDALATYVAAASAIPADDERGAAACAVAADDLREAIAEGTVGDVPLVRRALAVLQDRAALPNIRQGAA